MGTWRFQETATPPAAAIPGQRIGPASPQPGTVAEQITVPLGQSVISGLGAASAVAVGAWAFWDQDPASWGPWAIVAGVLTFGASWAALMTDARGLLRVAEAWGDPAPDPQPQGKPSERVIFVRGGEPGTHAEGEPQAPAADPGPQGPGDFERFMASALVSTALADLERRWPRPYVQSMRDSLIGAGLASWAGKGKNAGWQLTPRGRAVAERCKSTLGGLSK